MVVDSERTHKLSSLVHALSSDSHFANKFAIFDVLNTICWFGGHNLYFDTLLIIHIFASNLAKIWSQYWHRIYGEEPEDGRFGRDEGQAHLGCGVC